MNLNEFNQLLAAQPNANIIYKIQEAQQVLVNQHVHLTEIKQQHVQSVDCGGKSTSWTDIILQLWSHSKKDDGHRVNAQKMLDIIKQVNNKLPLKTESELLIEYRGDDNKLSHYYIELISSANSEIQFKLSGLKTQCKAAEECSTTQNCCNSSENEKPSKHQSCCA
ncbi:MAG: hypothetical protein HRU38_21745 [Saccharospirillaceae bacterium]|nr:DUF6428 family protein [Pseudomonadales bacterium]NRB81254.1 hypothetical protein [Saccharospirillaceae bacterium]